MNITLEMVDQVRERTGASYEKAKDALEKAGGSVVDAIIALEREDRETSGELTEKIKRAIKKGDVNRIRISKDGKELVNIPVNAGVVGGVLGLMMPGALIATAVASAVAAYGFGCKFEIVRNDGTVEEIHDVTNQFEENPDGENKDE